MKTCSQCKESKPLDAYNKRKDARDGYMAACRPCDSELRKKRKNGRRISQVGPELTTDQKKHVYTSVIVRMRQLGLTSDVTTNEMLERVGSL